MTIQVQFGAQPLQVGIGEHTDIALRAAASALNSLALTQAITDGTLISGTLAEREAIPLDQRKNGRLFYDRDANRMYQWVKAGSPRPVGGSLATFDGWSFWWTLDELNNMAIGKTNVLPVENQAGMATALANIADLAAVQIADFRATALTPGDHPLVELNARLLGLKPDAIKVAYGGVQFAIAGLPWRPKDQAAVKDFFVAGNSLDDATDVPMWHTILAERRGVTSYFTARYSSDKHQLARAGLDPTVLTFAGNTLPVGGTPEAVASINGHSPIDINADYALLSTGDASLTTGVTLQGVIVDATNSRHGTLAVPNAASAAYTFTQDAGLPAITLSGPVTFIPDLAKYPKICDNFIGVQNDFYSGVPGALGNHTNPFALERVDRFAAAADGNRFLFRDVLPDATWPADGTPAGPIDGTDYGNHLFAAMEAFNAEVEARHPGSRARTGPKPGYPNGMTLLQYLQSRGDGSAGANADVAAGYTPRNLRIAGDGLHLNLAGQTAMADFFEEAMAAQVLAPTPDLNTYFTLLVTGTKPALYPDEPVTSTASAVAGVQVDARTDMIIQEAIDMLTAGTVFASASVEISAGMVAGTEPVLAASSTRRTVLLRSPKPAKFALHAGSSDVAIDLPAEQDKLLNPAPKNAIYLVGAQSLLAEHDRLTIEVG